MIDNNVQYLECEGMHVAVSLETKVSQEHQFYTPATLLVFVQEGQFTIRHEKQVHSALAGNFCLLRQHTLLSVTKTWSAAENEFRMFVFLFQPEFIRDILRNLPLPSGPAPVCALIPLPRTSILMGLMHSIAAYFSGHEDVERQLIQLKTLEALLGVTQHRPDLIRIFHELATPIRADLSPFIAYHLTKNLPLEELARLSGRSLSTFNRDFRRLYHVAPHQWIRQQRLLRAKELLVQTGRKPSDIYLEVGFEDLAHFSRSFKQFFGENPSVYGQSRVAVLDK